jgi:glucokinase
MILAGDIGGTNARLAFFDAMNGNFRLVAASVFPSRNYSGLDQIVNEFVEKSNVHADLACFGVAGPVRNGRVETSNLPWIIDSKHLGAELGVKNALLINDLEANAWGISMLDPEDVVSLNQVKGNPVGNQAVISAGTGLGEAGMYWDGTQHQVFACEGGHTDFAPRNQLEMDLLQYLHNHFGHVSYERVVSGPGLVNLFHFLRDTGRGTEPAWLSEQMLKSDPAAAISKAGLERKCPLCEQTVDLFVSLYAAEAGNLALKLMATGGVYLGGGIAPRLLAKLAGPLFMQSFASKGRMQTLMEAMPVRVITNDKTALLGAARFASLRS